MKNILMLCAKIVIVTIAIEIVAAIPFILFFLLK